MSFDLHKIKKKCFLGMDACMELVFKLQSMIIKLYITHHMIAAQSKVEGN